MFAVGAKGNMFKRGLSKEERRRLRCKHCHESGHEIDECFKLHGIPDWYKRQKENKDRYLVNFVERNEDAETVISGVEQKGYGMEISKIVQSEVAKYLSG